MICRPSLMHARKNHSYLSGYSVSFWVTLLRMTSFFFSPLSFMLSLPMIFQPSVMRVRNNHSYLPGYSTPFWLILLHTTSFFFLSFSFLLAFPCSSNLQWCVYETIILIYLVIQLPTLFRFMLSPFPLLSQSGLFFGRPSHLQWWVHGSSISFVLFCFVPSSFLPFSFSLVFNVCITFTHACPDVRSHPIGLVILFPSWASFPSCPIGFPPSAFSVLVSLCLTFTPSMMYVRKSHSYNNFQFFFIESPPTTPFLQFTFQ